jgi:hypothetical protein
MAFLFFSNTEGGYDEFSFLPFSPQGVFSGQGKQFFEPNNSPILPIPVIADTVSERSDALFF